MRHTLLVIVCSVVLSSSVLAAEERVELIEQLGKNIPLQMNFIDSTGETVSLDQLIDRPTLVVPVFYDCRNVCNMLLGRLSAVLPEIKMNPGEDYNVVTFSFDPLETPEMAAHSKQTFLTATQVSFPPKAWRFVIGTRENILQLTDAAGYYFKKEGDEFLHPITAFVVTKDGTIVRYLPGQSFSAIDLSMALFEASEGRIGKPIRQALQFCFSYDPEGRRYVFNLMRVSGTVILLTLGSFLLFLILGGRKKNK